jgi:PAS domain S-box-containing protein
MYSIALFRFNILSPVPLARETVIDQMHEGILVVDRQERVVSLNPAAERVFGLSARQVKGKPVREILPAYPQEFQEVRSGTVIEFRLARDGATSDHRMEISQLNDWRGLDVGRLLVLQDVTGQKRAQALLLAQQRALAMLKERERLARELHDSLGQVLSFASLKIGAARKLISDRKPANADDQLASLEGILAGAHADVREYILNLRTAPDEKRPFFITLRSYLDGFHQNYGIQVDMSIGKGVDDGVFAPESRMELFHILQEAFSNVRKHAGTSCVHLSFERKEDLVQICVQDDGRGFDPRLVEHLGGDHFGLSFMREAPDELSIPCG